MRSVLVETLRIYTASAPFLLVGFALAGVLHVLLSRSQRLAGLLNRPGGRSVWLAAVIGAPLPLCSCSVLPAGLALRRKGASKGATASFLISVPETDVVSVMMTYGLLGPLMAIYRPLAAVMTAVITGHAIDLAERSQESADEPQTDAQKSSDEYNNQKSALWNAWHYGFVSFFDDIILSLVLGVVLGGAITALLPALGWDGLAGGSIGSLLAMLVVGIPMYVCASASTPIAAGMIAGGISPGAAMVFLLAGPATNMASLTVLAKHLGGRTLGVYLVCIAVLSVLAGLGLDALIESAALPQFEVVPRACQAGSNWLEIGAGVAFGVLAVISLWRTRFGTRCKRRT